MARHGSGRRNGLSGRTKKLDSELWQQDVDQQNGTRGSFRFPPDRRHQKRTTDVLRKPDNCKSYRQFAATYSVTANTCNHRWRITSTIPRCREDSGAVFSSPPIYRTTGASDMS